MEGLVRSRDSNHTALERTRRSMRPELERRMCSSTRYMATEGSLAMSCRLELSSAQKRFVSRSTGAGVAGDGDMPPGPRNTPYPSMAMLGFGGRCCCLAVLLSRCPVFARAFSRGGRSGWREGRGGEGEGEGEVRVKVGTSGHGRGLHRGCKAAPSRYTRTRQQGAEAMARCRGCVSRC